MENKSFGTRRRYFSPASSLVPAAGTQLPRLEPLYVLPSCPPPLPRAFRTVGPSTPLSSGMLPGTPPQPGAARPICLPLRVVPPPEFLPLKPPMSVSCQDVDRASGRGAFVTPLHR